MIKMTLGLQPHHIERIEQELKRYDSYVEDSENKGFMLWDRDFWIELGAEFTWEPLTLSLHYFNYLNNLKQEAGENAYWLLTEHLPPLDKYKTELNEIGKIFNIE